MERKPAVAVVFHHIGPYHHARLNAAADRLSVTGIEWSAKGYDAWGVADVSCAVPQNFSLPGSDAPLPRKSNASTSVLFNVGAGKS